MELGQVSRAASLLAHSIEVISNNVYSALIDYTISSQFTQEKCGKAPYFFLSPAYLW